MTLVFIFLRAIILLHLGRRFLFVLSALGSMSFTQVFRVCYCLALPGSFFSPRISVIDYLFEYNQFGELFFILALPGIYSSVPLVSLSRYSPFPLVFLASVSNFLKCMFVVASDSRFLGNFKIPFMVMPDPLPPSPWHKCPFSKIA